jgi:hypothetical protein
VLERAEVFGNAVERPPRHVKLDLAGLRLG